ncbi:hypothetical protein SLE2022_106750 [Rubroshorea leprosula]
MIPYATTAVDLLANFSRALMLWSLRVFGLGLRGNDPPSPLPPSICPPIFPAVLTGLNVGLSGPCFGPI